MIWAQLLVVLLFIYLGARLGGIGIGFMGGMGVVALSLLGLKPGAIPFDVISVIMSVIMAIAAMQVAGGMDFLVKVAEKILRKNPKYITFLAPTVTYFMTVLAGTGQYNLYYDLSFSPPRSGRRKREIKVEIELTSTSKYSHKVSYSWCKEGNVFWIFT